MLPTRMSLGFLLGFGLLLATIQPGVASTLEEVKSQGTMRVGVRFDTPPYGYIDKAGQNAGYDIDVVKNLAKKLGVKIKFIQVTGKTRIPMLESGKVDVLVAATTHTRKRDKQIDFTIPYLLTGSQLVTKSGSKIAALGDLDGKTVATVQGTTGEKIVRERAKGAKLQVYQEWPQAFLALKQGLADAICVGQFVGAKFAAEDSDFQLVGPLLLEEPIAMGVRENDSAWRDALNFALQDAVRDGDFAAIWHKWFGKKSQYNLPLWTPGLWP